MQYITNFFAFWYDFIIGDDWTVAAGVVVALAITAVLHVSGLNAWWLPLIAVIALLGASVWRVSRAG